jgi:hypothetical protein
MTVGKFVDFFDIRALLSDDERLIRDTVARFVDRDVVPIIADWLRPASRSITVRCGTC